MEDQPQVCEETFVIGERKKTQTWFILNFRGKDPMNLNNLAILSKITRTAREKEHWEFLKTGPLPPPTPRSSRQLMCSSARGPDPEIIVSLEETEQMNSCCFMHSGTQLCIFFCLEASEEKANSFLLRMRHTTCVNKG